MKLAALVCAAFLATCPAAAADQFPSRPITIIQGFGAGGSADTLARILGDWYSRQLGQPVVVEGRAGAGGNIASEQVSKANPDGHTLLLLPASHTVSAAMYEKLRFDPEQDFTFVSILMEYPLAIVTSPKSPFNSLEDALRAGKTDPNGVTFSSVGHGSAMHLAGEWIAMLSGAKLIHVPYRGGAQPLVDVMAGRTDLMIATPAATVEAIKAGNVRGLANTGRNQHPALPGLPPASAVLPEFQVLSWLGVAGPKGMPASVAEKLNEVTSAALRDPDFKKRLDTLGGASEPRTLEATREFVMSDIRRWRDVVNKAAIKKM